jgi:hypothetical protein
MRRSLRSDLLLLAACLISTIAGTCVPDYPDKLLADPAILQHPSIAAAFKAVEENLSALYVNTTRDGLSFVVVSTLTHVLAPPR